MCGIIGYIGKKQAIPIVMDGLKQLEYRGYDSAGVALWDGDRLKVQKSAGRVSELEKEFIGEEWRGNVAIAHTRWATHGKPISRNAHPHTDCSGTISVVHNGIIENYINLKDVLIREGHVFKSETDSEVLAHLIERAFLICGNTVSLKDAVSEGLRHIFGTFGIAVISSRDPNIIVAARRGSPLIVGVGTNENLVASDVSAIVGSTKNIVYLHDNDMVVISPFGYQISSFSKKLIQRKIETIDWSIEAAQKSGFSHFMQKEIFEGPLALENALRGRVIAKTGEIKLGGLEGVTAQLLDIRRIVIVACGTSYYSGLIGKYYFEEFVKIPVSVEYASEFRYSNPAVDAKTAVLCISQSGETADTLEALREAKEKGALVLGIVNVVGSTIARESDAGVYNHAGPEIGVASTKAFISQLGVLLSMVLFWKSLREAPDSLTIEITRELKSLSSKMHLILNQNDAIKTLAQKYLPYRDMLFIGRRYQYPVALEGALKLKEISYKYAEGYAAGELKHGPIALIDSNTPTIALCLHDSMYEKMLSNIEEIKARNGKVIAIATHGDDTIKKIADDVIFIPRASEALIPLLSIIPLQLFAYHTAELLGLDVDKPRNLAKSVTVE